MFFTTAVAILAATRMVFAGSVNFTITTRTCGSQLSQEEVLAYESHFATNRISGNVEKAAAISNFFVYFHVISTIGIQGGIR